VRTVFIDCRIGLRLSCESQAEGEKILSDLIGRRPRRVMLPAPPGETVGLEVTLVR
jgi:hypothetical protein